MPTLTDWLPGRSWFGRIGWLIVIAMLSMHIAGFYFYGHDRLVASARTFAIGLAERTYELDRLIAEQPKVLEVVQTPGFELRRVPSSADVGRTTWPHLDEIVGPVRDHLKSLGLNDSEQVRVSYSVRHGPGRMQILIPSRGGEYLLASSIVLPNFEARSSSSGAFMSLILLTIILIVLWVTRRQAVQLNRFVSAAEALSLGRAAELPENVGPKELRRASTAFNQMQREVLRLLEERSDMLAGVSHDIRTLATRLGLRLEQLADESERERAARDVALITQILNQALTFTNDEATEEPFETVDLVPMLQTLVDELSAAGASLQGEDSLVLACQPTATKRLFLNLLDNALKYGEQAEVAVHHNRVVIKDQGAGFATDEVETAIKPYARLDQARSQAKPGAGLGLALAQNVCRRHEWRLDFAQSDDGFSVTVWFDAADA